MTNTELNNEIVAKANRRIVIHIASRILVTAVVVGVTTAVCNVLDKSEETN